MNLQKFKKASVLIFSAFFILKSTFVSAGVTHTAKIEMGLSVVNGSGTITEVQNMNGDFSLDWSNGKCELKVKNLKKNTFFNYNFLNKSKTHSII